MSAFKNAYLENELKRWVRPDAGLNQAISRGVSPSAILNAVVSPLQIIPQANGTTRYVGSGAVVVLNPAGRVVTVWGR